MEGDGPRGKNHRRCIGKLSSVSVERRAESGKFEKWLAIFIEGTPMTVDFGDTLYSIC
jgi:hypothetical protein